jgi:hypothetical protein
MRSGNLDTWRRRSDRKRIFIHLSQHRRSALESQHRTNQGGIRKGVLIVLSPEFTEAYSRAGSTKITTQPCSEFAGRFLGINLTFPKTDPFGKRVPKSDQKLFIASIYHPWKEEEYDDFNETACQLLSQAPHNAIKIVGHDLNANIGTHMTKDKGAHNNIIGPFGINNRNKKGEAAIEFLHLANLRAMSTFFGHPSYVTHTQKLDKDQPPMQLMLDTISVSTHSAKYIRDCKV